MPCFATSSSPSAGACAPALANPHTPPPHRFQFDSPGQDHTLSSYAELLQLLGEDASETFGEVFTGLWRPFAFEHASNLSFNARTHLPENCAGVQTAYEQVYMTQCDFDERLWLGSETPEARTPAKKRLHEHTPINRRMFLWRPLAPASLPPTPLPLNQPAINPDPFKVPKHDQQAMGEVS